METWQIRGTAGAEEPATMPCARRIAPTFCAISSSPVAVGCRPLPSKWANFHRPVSGSMMIAAGPAARAAVTMASSVRS
jgi:hypothetical protein